MPRETIDTVAKWLVVLLTMGACFYLLAAVPTVDPIQPWTIIGLVIGWIIRDSAGNTSSANLARVAAMQPTITTNGTTTVTAPEPYETPASPPAYPPSGG